MNGRNIKSCVLFNIKTNEYIDLLLLYTYLPISSDIWLFLNTNTTIRVWAIFD